MNSVRRHHSLLTYLFLSDILNNNRILLSAVRKTICPVGNWESGLNPEQPSLLCLAFAISQNTSAAAGFADLDDEEVQPIIHNAVSECAHFSAWFV